MKIRKDENPVTKAKRMFAEEKKLVDEYYSRRQNACDKERRPSGQPSLEWMEEEDCLYCEPADGAPDSIFDEKKLYEEFHKTLQENQKQLEVAQLLLTKIHSRLEEQINSTDNHITKKRLCNLKNNLKSAADCKKDNLQHTMESTAEEISKYLASTEKQSVLTRLLVLIYALLDTLRCETKPRASSEVLGFSADMRKAISYCEEFPKRQIKSSPH